MRKLLPILIALLFITLGKTTFSQAFSFAPGQLTYSENFDAMGAAGTSYLTGWTAIRSAGTGTVGATLTMGVSSGTSNSGNVYNAGSTGAADRAFGSLASGTTIPRFGASYLNNTGATIVQVAFTGVMEQWRSGSNAAINEVVAFEYSLDATDLSTGTWTAFTSMDLLEKVIGSTVADSLDGNLDANKTALAGTLSGLNWPSGTQLWIRWTDVNDIGSDGMMAIDNLGMTVTTGTVVVDPEPTNYPTGLTITGQGNSLKVSWTDATGAQAPDGYLVKISATDNITAPVDGTYTTDDIDVSDGAGAKNISQGVQEYTFSDLASATTYYVKIYPYTNAGTLVDYKTDGTVPSGNARTQLIISSQDFSTGLLDPWTQFSVLGDQIWMTDTISNNIFVKMSGFVSGTSIENEDWLISPSLNIPAGSSPTLQFRSAMNYGLGIDEIQLFVTDNYTSGDPTPANWTEITELATFSSGSWTWTPSGLVSLAGHEGSNIHVAFRYTCGTANVPTWELDNIVISHNSGVGIQDPNSTKTSLKVYPNPCTNGFYAQVPVRETYTLSIFNAQGQLVNTMKVQDQSTFVSTNDFTSGMYYVVLKDANLKQIDSLKLIVK